MVGRTTLIPSTSSGGATMGRGRMTLTRPAETVQLATPLSTSITSFSSKSPPVTVPRRIAADIATTKTSKAVDINHSLMPTRTQVHKVKPRSTSRGLSSTSAYTTSLINDRTLDPVANAHNAPLHNIDHTMVFIIAIVIGGIVLMTGMITLGVSVVAKRRRTRADADHHYTMPSAGHTLASYTASAGTRTSNTYEYIPYATTTSLESSNDGYLNPTANDDYLKPVDGVVYYSIRDDSDELATLYNIPDANPYF